MIFTRHKRRRREILAAQDKAAEQLQRAREQVARATEIGDKLEESRRRNHYGEAIRASFQPKPRKILPWSH